MPLELHEWVLDRLSYAHLRGVKMGLEFAIDACNVKPEVTTREEILERLIKLVQETSREITAMENPKDVAGEA